MTRGLSFSQSMKLTEHTALKVLREQLFAHKSDLISVFQEFDKENAGLISLDSWAAAIERVLHLDLPWRVLRPQLVSNTAEDMLDYHAWFRDLALKRPGCEHIEQTLLEALYRHRSTMETIFRIVDTDNSGFITFEDFRQTLKLLGAYLKMEISDEAINELVINTDTNNDGSIDIDEFMEAFRLVDKSRLERGRSLLKLKQENRDLAQDEQTPQPAESASSQIVDSPDLKTADSSDPQTGDGPGSQTADSSHLQTATSQDPKIAESSAPQTADSPGIQTVDSPSSQTADS